MSLDVESRNRTRIKVSYNVESEAQSMQKYRGHEMGSIVLYLGGSMYILYVDKQDWGALKEKN